MPWSYTAHSVHYTRRVGATTIRRTGQRCLGSHERTHYALKQRTMGWTRFWRSVLISSAYLSLIARYILNFRMIVLWLLERYFLKMHKNHRIRKYLNPLCDTTIALTFYLLCHNIVTSWTFIKAYSSSSCSIAQIILGDWLVASLI